MLKNGTQLVNRWEIIDLLGQGSQGVVYLARDLTQGWQRHVAIKVLQQHQDTESHIAAHVNHPHVIAIYDKGNIDGMPWYAMEYVAEAVSLEEKINAQMHIDMATIKLWIMQIASGLTALHTQHIIHRDIKPDNILLMPITTGWHVKLLDFGIATPIDINLSGLHGTPGYVPPEAIEHTDATPQPTWDMFALGVCLYRLLTHQLPFDGKDDFDILNQILHYHPPKPSTYNKQIPMVWDDITMRLLAKNPQHRYQDAATLYHDLEALEDDKKIDGVQALCESLRLLDEDLVDMHDDIDDDLKEAYIPPAAPCVDIETIHATAWHKLPKNIKLPLMLGGLFMLIVFGIGFFSAKKSPTITDSPIAFDHHAGTIQYQDATIADFKHAEQLFHMQEKKYDTHIPAHDYIDVNPVPKPPPIPPIDKHKNMDLMLNQSSADEAAEPVEQTDHKLGIAAGLLAEAQLISHCSTLGRSIAHAKITKNIRIPQSTQEIPKGSLLFGRCQFSNNSQQGIADIQFDRIIVHNKQYKITASAVSKDGDNYLPAITSHQETSTLNSAIDTALDSAQALLGSSTIENVAQRIINNKRHNANNQQQPSKHMHVPRYTHFQIIFEDDA